MKNGKKNIILLALLFLLLPLILIPSSYGALTNIWGTSVGTVRTYTFTTTYTGDIQAVSDYGDHIFTIVNIWDNDANNYTELLYSRQRILLGSPVVDLITLDDAAGSWSALNLMYPVNIPLRNIDPLVPVAFNATDSMGLNWTLAIELINLVDNYTATLDGNVLTIHYWENGLHEYIKWDRSTGWLISYEIITSYSTPADYEETTAVKLKSAPGGVAIDITVIIGIIGAICGALAVAVAYLAYRKSKR
ncbi:MAG: hypothetical protein HWN66_01375 [Candidatus Helarchaeota archaeon]|nr:hypothetical protein [Candidatus Helarchaeota archaeon]